MKNDNLKIAEFANKNREQAYKRYAIIEKVKAAIKMIIVIFVSLYIGFLIGKRYVIMNQCITSEDCTPGNYISILDEHVNVYWYE